jgi:hypothetical protein
MRHAFREESHAVILPRLRRCRGSRRTWSTACDPDALQAMQADRAFSSSRFAGNEMRAAVAPIVRSARWFGKRRVETLC